MSVDIETQRIIGGLMARMDDQDSWRASTDKKLDEILEALLDLRGSQKVVRAAGGLAKWIGPGITISLVVAVWHWLQEHIRW